MSFSHNVHIKLCKGVEDYINSCIKELKKCGGNFNAEIDKKIQQFRQQFMKDMDSGFKKLGEFSEEKIDYLSDKLKADALEITDYFIQQLTIELTKAGNSGKDELEKMGSKVKDGVDAIARQFLDNLSHEIKDIECQTKEDAEKLIDKFYDIVHTLPFADQSPRLFSINQKVIFVNRDLPHGCSQVIIRGVFLNALKDNPTLNLGGHSYAPNGGSLAIRKLTFDIPHKKIPLSKNALTFIQAKLKVPVDYWLKAEEEYTIPLIAINTKEDIAEIKGLNKDDKEFEEKIFSIAAEKGILISDEKKLQGWGPTLWRGGKYLMAAAAGAAGAYATAAAAKKISDALAEASPAIKATCALGALGGVYGYAKYEKPEQKEKPAN